jgi:hypothetical protein
MADQAYVDHFWSASPAIMAAALTALGWAPDGAEPTQPRHAAVAGFVVAAATDVAGAPAWAALIRATEALPLPAGVQPAPQWVADALVGRIAELGALPPISRRQLLLGLAAEGLITGEEALAAAQSGAVPAAVEVIFAGLPQADQLGARLTWAAMSQAERRNPLVGLMATAHGISPSDLDALWAGWVRL